MNERDLPKQPKQKSAAAARREARRNAAWENYTKARAAALAASAEAARLSDIASKALDAWVDAR